MAHRTNPITDISRILAHRRRTWTPVLTADTTNPTLGTNSVATGRFSIVGDVVHGDAYFYLGDSGFNAGSGRYHVSLPAPCSGLVPSGNGGQGSIVGSWHVRDQGTPNWRGGNLQYRTSTTALFLLLHATQAVDHNTPYAWTNGDRFHLWFTYFHG